MVKEFGLISHQWLRAESLRNLKAHARALVQLRSRRPARWRTAHILDDDGSVEGQHTLRRNNPWRRMCLNMSQALAVEPGPVRVDLGPEAPTR